MGFLQRLNAALVVLGCIVVTYFVVQTVLFIRLHFFHESTLHRYRKVKGSPEDSSWALVTGATDGIGKGFAEELCDRGFNVILHGRNQHKLEAVKSDLNKRWPNQQVQILRIDASKDASSPDAFSRAAQTLSSFDLRVLINNIGGSGGLLSFMALHERSAEEVKTIMDVNARFPTEVTRALLPQLRARAPALIINLGSATSEIALPYLSVYSGCKSYNKGWSRSLTAELKAEKSNIECFCLLVSAVVTPNAPRPVSLFAPTARTMAKAGLDKVGCGRSLLFGYWGHALQAVLVQAIPESIAEKFFIDTGIKEKAADEERMKKK